ncbi:MAG TPA: ABC transporter ATP-binding protein [Candidatus Xenobia bacterium]|jgi:ABC-2 type transport system ATP-binding protein
MTESNDKAAPTRSLEGAVNAQDNAVRTPRPEDDVVVRTPRPEDDVVVRTPRPEDDVVPPERSGNAVLKVRSLCKRFGRTQAVSDIGFTLYAGDVLGLVGGNGAGKTTTLRILATVLKPDSGEFELDGFTLKQTLQIRERLGYMPDFLGVYEDLLVCEYLEFFARAYHIDEARLDFRINEVVEFAGLKDVLQRPVEGLSRGMTQRLGLARALIHGPRLLLLDEPASGLDPRARLEFRDMVRHLQRQGKVVIVSSHILADLADMCNKIAIIDRGRLVALEETAHMINRADGDRRYKVTFLARAEDGFKALKEWAGVKDVTWDGSDLVFAFDGSRQAAADLLKALIQQNFVVAGFNELPGSLERAYLNLTQGK